MKCQACEEGDHQNCGMQTWCDCDCDPESIDFGSPDDIVGHKTFATGDICPETGFPKMRHEKAQAERAERMPDEQSAIRAFFDAQQRLKELGWRDGVHIPRDGTTVRVIELGSTGIFDCDCSGEWPNCTWTTYDEHDAYPSSQHPAFFKLKPEDQAKYDARMAEARVRYQAEREAELALNIQQRQEPK